VAARQVVGTASQTGDGGEGGREIHREIVDHDGSVTTEEGAQDEEKRTRDEKQRTRDEKQRTQDEQQRTQDAEQGTENNESLKTSIGFSINIKLLYLEY
jgi:hypothetical protein